MTSGATRCATTVPSGTPPLVRTSSDMKRKENKPPTAVSPETSSGLAAVMMAEPAPMTPALFSAFVRDELQKYRKLVADSGASAD